jgi:hypothetical protein
MVKLLSVYEVCTDDAPLCLRHPLSRTAEAHYTARIFHHPHHIKPGTIPQIPLTPSQWTEVEGADRDARQEVASDELSVASRDSTEGAVLNLLEWLTFVRRAHDLIVPAADEFYGRVHLTHLTLLEVGHPPIGIQHRQTLEGMELCGIETPPELELLDWDADPLGDIASEDMGECEVQRTDVRHIGYARVHGEDGLLSPQSSIGVANEAGAPTMPLSFVRYVSAAEVCNNSSLTFSKSNGLTSLKEPRGFSEIQVFPNETCPPLPIEPQISTHVEVVGHRSTSVNAIVSDAVDGGNEVYPSVL